MSGFDPPSPDPRRPSPVPPGLEDPPTPVEKHQRRPSFGQQASAFLASTFKTMRGTQTQTLELCMPFETHQVPTPVRHFLVCRYYVSKAYSFTHLEQFLMRS